ncbi:divalent-cation tolerance protein CutA [Roseomonas gilardii]|nr:divalent-cation tolerance protein CutA [Roseomonas gilardii]
MHSPLPDARAAKVRRSLVLPVPGGSAAYLDWIEANVRPAQRAGEQEG